MAYLFLGIGLLLLIKGADFFVDGASKLAILLRISPIVVGLTIVSFGTSAPEATISIIAALEGSSDISIGNVVGSNILNITLIIGVAAFLYPIQVSRETIRNEIPFTFLSGVVLLVLISDTMFKKMPNVIDRSDGVILLLFLVIFLYYVFQTAAADRKNSKPTDSKKYGYSWWKSTLLIIGGLAGVIFGGNLVVTHATTIAYSLGMSEALVGLTIISIGTSLPELVTSITAALKKQSEIALGNIVGSNIFNVLFVLGAASVIEPLPINGKIFSDMFIMLALTILLLVFSRTNFRLDKREGLSLVGIYIIYLVYIIIRN